jgi:hypothetical protein
MSTIKSSADHIVINADGASKDIKFQANGVEKASISSAGAFTSTTIDATKLTGNLPAISGASLTGISGGKVLQVVQTHVTTTSSQSITATVRANISGLNASITPSSTSSKIRVTVRWNGESSYVALVADSVFGIKRGSTDVGNPAAAGSRPVGISVGSQGHYTSDAAASADSAMYEYIDSPSSTSAITYYATFLAAASQTLYNQRTVSDTNGINYERTTSTITLEEIGA